MKLTETYRYDMDGVLVDLSYPRIASEGDEIRLSMSMSKERSDVNVKRISLRIFTRLQDGSIWSQRNFYHGNLAKERVTANTVFSVPYGLEQNSLDLEVKVEYAGRNGTSIVKHGKIITNKRNSQVLEQEDSTKVAKNELESKLSEVISRMELLENSNMKLNQQLLDLEDRKNELAKKKSEGVAKLSRLQKMRSAITTAVPTRIEVDKNITNYVKENPGSPFILGFIGLLIGAAIKLSTGYQDFANTLAVYAYYALVIGVLAQIINFAVRRKSVSDFSEATYWKTDSRPSTIHDLSFV